VLDGSLATPSFLLKSGAKTHVIYIHKNKALACKMPVICPVMATALAFPSASSINPYLVLPKTGALAEMASVWPVGPDRQVPAVSSTDRAAQQEFFTFARAVLMTILPASLRSATAPRRSCDALAMKPHGVLASFTPNERLFLLLRGSQCSDLGAKLSLSRSKLYKWEDFLSISA